MQSVMWITTIVLLLGNLGLLAFMLKRLAAKDKAQDELSALREIIATLEKAVKDEIRASQANTANTLVGVVGKLGEGQSQHLGDVIKSIETTVNTLVKTVSELGKTQTEKLAKVERGIGEMRTLATEVGDLTKILKNPRARGTWGEFQLEALLEQVLTPDQYDKNVKIKEDSREVVEFAIRLPGSDDQPDSCVWLPIDSKFTVASYERLVKAADPETKEQATKEFLRTVASNAKKIRDKYIAPPQTTDFAIMFLPTEGLYAEVLRQLDEVTDLQTKYRIVVAGPITLAAILSSLRLGFQTLTIQQRSSEVWEALAAVKTEFDKLDEVMTKLKRQRNTVANTVEEIDVRIRAMERILREVEKL